MAPFILRVSQFTAAEACRVEHAWNASNTLTIKEVSLQHPTLFGGMSNDHWATRTLLAKR
jgi:hypothetical protein